MFVLGTAGHIDHGKSLLVRALTGIDPDRLAEEKARGMTIDLGFAWMTLPSGREVGIVDVPGHERFVRNMLAGVGGIDIAMLVVAANEGVMPQTREHLAIIDLLEIRRGVAVITKKDLVDDELLSLVAMEVEEVLAPTTLAGAPVVAVSAVTGEGLPELVATLDHLLDESQPRPDVGRARLPVDRVFTVGGSGTVVTGTLIDGSLAVGQGVEIVPAGLKSRLRGLQMHRTRVEAAPPGSRVAANLVGVTTNQIRRGDVVTHPGWLKPTTLLTGRLKVLGSQVRPVRHNAQLSFFTGAAEAMAAVRVLDGEMVRPGESGWVQLVLDRPLAVVDGDHFIIRSSTDTLGGGRIVEAHSRRLRRRRPDVIRALETREKGSPEERLLALLEEKQPLTPAVAAGEAGLPPEMAESLVAGLVEWGRLVSTGQGEGRLLWTAGGWERLVSKARGLLEEYHRRFTVRPGMPRTELAARLAPSGGGQALVAALAEKGVVVDEGVTVRLPGHTIRFTPAQQAAVDAFKRELRRNPYAPASASIPQPDLLAVLVARGEVVKVADGIVFSSTAFEEMVAAIRAHIQEHGQITLAEVRDLFGTSRKYAQALLEYLDSHKVTRRVGDVRVLT